MYKIEINEVYEDKFDFSEYRENSKFHGNSNKTVIGQIKGKTAGFRIVDLVGLKSKMYSCIGKDDTGNNNATGIIKKRYWRYDTKKNMKILFLERSRWDAKWKEY